MVDSFLGCSVAVLLVEVGRDSQERRRADNASTIQRTEAPFGNAVAGIACWTILLSGPSLPAAAPVHDAVQPVVPLKAVPFDLEDVRLLPGPFRHAMELDQKYLLALDPDRLLHTFRLNAGLPSSARPLGAGKQPKIEVRGHFTGHYLSACALMYASTGDERFKDRGEQVVAGLAECQRKLGIGLSERLPEEFIDRVEHQSRVWAPWYTLHKILAGLLDMYVYCQQRAGTGCGPQVRRLGQVPDRPPERRPDAGDAGQRARRHERGAGEPLRPDRR